jgi:propanol-preferring alcohol dehydrogenase
MRAMVLEAPGRALTAMDLPDPLPGPGQVLVEVKACGVCRTDLHVLDGDLPFPGHRVVPGHEVAIG